MATPTGMLSLPLSYLRDALADCAAFQAWTGAANATEAKGSIAYVSAPSSLDLPFAVVGFGPSDHALRGRGGLRNAFDSSGDLRLDFWGSVASSDLADEGDEALGFLSTVGAILGELLELAGQAGYLDIVGVSVGEPMRPAEEEAQTSGDFHLLRCVVRYQGAA